MATRTTGAGVIVSSATRLVSKQVAQVHETGTAAVLSHFYMHDCVEYSHFRHIKVNAIRLITCVISWVHAFSRRDFKILSGIPYTHGFEPYYVLRRSTAPPYGERFPTELLQSNRAYLPCV